MPYDGPDRRSDGLAQVGHGLREALARGCNPVERVRTETGGRSGTCGLYSRKEPEPALAPNPEANTNRETHLALKNSNAAVSETTASAEIPVDDVGKRTLGQGFFISGEHLAALPRQIVQRLTGGGWAEDEREDEGEHLEAPQHAISAASVPQSSRPAHALGRRRLALRLQGEPPELRLGDATLVPRSHREQVGAEVDLAEVIPAFSDLTLPLGVGMGGHQDALDSAGRR